MPTEDMTPEQVYYAVDKVNRQSGGGPQSGGDWHIDILCTLYGFTLEEAGTIKCEFDRTIQGIFGGNTSENQPTQYTIPRSPVRAGDPSGVIGWVFSVSRKMYFATEQVPFLNDLRLWSAIDCFVLRNSNDETVQRYIVALRGLQPVRT